MATSSPLEVTFPDDESSYELIDSFSPWIDSPFNDDVPLTGLHANFTLLKAFVEAVGEDVLLELIDGTFFTGIFGGASPDMDVGLYCAYDKTGNGKKEIEKVQFAHSDIIRLTVISSGVTLIDNQHLEAPEREMDGVIGTSAYNDLSSEVEAETTETAAAVPSHESQENRCSNCSTIEMSAWRKVREGLLCSECCVSIYKNQRELEESSASPTLQSPSNVIEELKQEEMPTEEKIPSNTTEYLEDMKGNTMHDSDVFDTNNTKNRNIVEETYIESIQYLAQQLADSQQCHQNNLLMKDEELINMRYLLEETKEENRRLREEKERNDLSATELFEALHGHQIELWRKNDELSNLKRENEELLEIFHEERRRNDEAVSNLEEKLLEVEHDHEYHIWVKTEEMKMLIEEKDDYSRWLREEKRKSDEARLELNRIINENKELSNSIEYVEEKETGMRTQNGEKKSKDQIIFDLRRKLRDLGNEHETEMWTKTEEIFTLNMLVQDKDENIRKLTNEDKRSDEARIEMDRLAKENRWYRVQMEKLKENINSIVDASPLDRESIGSTSKQDCVTAHGQSLLIVPKSSAEISGVRWSDETVAVNGETPEEYRARVERWKEEDKKKDIAALAFLALFFGIMLCFIY